MIRDQQMKQVRRLRSPQPLLIEGCPPKCRAIALGSEGVSRHSGSEEAVQGIADRRLCIPWAVGAVPFARADGSPSKNIVPGRLWKSRTQADEPGSGRRSRQKRSGTAAGAAEGQPPKDSACEPFCAGVRLTPDLVSSRSTVGGRTTEGGCREAEDHDCLFPEPPPGRLAFPCQAGGGARHRAPPACPLFSICSARRCR